MPQHTTLFKALAIGGYFRFPAHANVFYKSGPRHYESLHYPGWPAKTASGEESVIMLSREEAMRHYGQR